MFPNSNSQIYYNEAGEVVGWDAPVDPDSFYCDICGYKHFGECSDPYDDEDPDIEGQRNEE